MNWDIYASVMAAFATVVAITFLAGVVYGLYRQRILQKYAQGVALAPVPGGLAPFAWYEKYDNSAHANPLLPFGERLDLMPGQTVVLIGSDDRKKRVVKIASSTRCLETMLGLSSSRSFYTGYDEAGELASFTEENVLDLVKFEEVAK